ncbi:MAG: sulfotransferase [Akkermansiaceae bacterium]
MKNFILGVGAQKSGTTWLHSQLMKNDSIDMGFAKEYHTFDAIFSEHCSFFRTDLLNTILENEKDGNLGRNKKSCMDAIRRLSFIDNTDNYFDYFDQLHSRNDKLKAVGDITPSYSMLTSEAFAHIRQGLEARGFRVKVIFLMRDPVERVWSMLRMGRRNATKKGKVFKNSETESLRRNYKSPAQELRTRYDRTLVELEKVFEPEDIFCDFYERLFTDHTYKALQSFLGLGLKSADFKFHSNVSAVTESLDSDLRAEIATYYSNVYDFVSNKTKGVSEKLWSGYQYL